MYNNVYKINVLKKKLKENKIWQEALNYFLLLFYLLYIYFIVAKFD